MVLLNEHKMQYQRDNYLASATAFISEALPPIEQTKDQKRLSLYPYLSYIKINSN